MASLDGVDQNLRIHAGRRRKGLDEDGYGDEDRVPPKRATTMDEDEEEESSGYPPGCGRVLCRKCCFENVER
jgi:hypothetical protein